MGFSRFHRLLTNKAMSLVEVMIAMAIISLVGVMMASGIVASLNIYKKGADLRKNMNGAREALYVSAVSDGDASAHVVFPEFFRKSNEIFKIHTYSYEVIGENSESIAEMYYYRGE